MEIPRITPQQIAERLDRGERVVFLDARSAQAMGEATERIPGSIRVPPDDVQRHARDLPRATTLVAYCT
jgi:rhodanese-related sulfurtransferase